VAVASIRDQAGFAGTGRRLAGLRIRSREAREALANRRSRHQRNLPEMDSERDDQEAGPGTKRGHKPEHGDGDCGSGGHGQNCRG
jgi:hypothetical protein